MHNENVENTNEKTELIFGGGGKGMKRKTEKNKINVFK